MPANSSTAAAIDDIFSDWNEANSPGVAVGIVRRGEPIYTRAFGLANVERGVPNTTSTVFDIGSMTKQFTAFAVLMLVRDDRLGLDNDVREFVPELPAYDPPIRVRHCLYHTCGLTDWIVALELAGPTEDYCSMKRAYRTITALRETMFPAGREHSYSNTGYVLLAWIVWRLTGKTLHEFLAEHVFEPLAMSRATFPSYPEHFLPNQAQGYYRDNDGRLYPVSWPSAVYGDGRMHASIEDMIRWLQNFSTRTVGDTELFDLFFAPGRLDNGQMLRHAAGWELDRHRGLLAIRHGGMAVGFQSHIAWFPEVNVGVAILGNVRPYLPWAMANSVFDALIEAHAVSPLPAETQTVSRKDTSPDSDDVTGRYFTATGLPVLVDRYCGSLRIDIWLWRRPFTKETADVFRESEFGDTIVFHRNAEGTVTHFTMKTTDGACPRMHSPIRTAVRFEHTTLDQVERAHFEGRYLSDDLDTVYTIVAEDDGLIAKHLRCHDWHLRPIKSCITGIFKDDFAQEGQWPGKVTFERDSNGDPEGFRVRGARVNLFFRKLLPVPERALS